jgi:hypothetical protein
MNEFVKSENINPRLVEIVLRCAAACTALDGLKQLCANYLPPFWELARYQTRVHFLLQPNRGKNFEGELGYKILQFLDAYAPDSQVLSYREVMMAVHAYDEGGPILERVVNSLKFAGLIIIEQAPSQCGRMMKTIRRARD